MEDLRFQLLQASLRLSDAAFFSLSIRSLLAPAFIAMPPPQKSVLITGCSPGGIGHALAREFHSHGLRVFATARSKAQIQDLEALGIQPLALTVDDHASVVACQQEVEALLDGRGLDYLINNAGKSMFRPAVELDLNEARALFATNVVAVMDMNQTFLPALLRARGTVIHVGSVAGQMPVPFNAAYSASKAALAAYSDTLRLELRPFGVGVVYVQTGIVNTNVMRHRTRLDDASLFRPLQPFFDGKQEEAATGGWAAERFAQALVPEVPGPRRDVLWVGAIASSSWLISTVERFLPFRLWPWILSRSYGLDRIGP